jgi:hypothetical protein
MANRFYSPNQQFCDTTGAPYAGGSLAFYASGTSTPLNTYSDAALTIPNTNPVVLDSAGRAGNIFLQNLAYKVVLSDANSNPIWTDDPGLFVGLFDQGQVRVWLGQARTGPRRERPDRLRSGRIPTGTPPTTSSMSAPRPARPRRRYGRRSMRVQQPQSSRCLKATSRRLAALRSYCLTRPP